ncbi:hypothetical protein BD289DRAFT_422433 [Coniella lustricola]|uniref:Uncharacterized protein n=1 Tax=Coniella lustricola TaxID=2025994 RepID=A0A2T3AL50_9PEZI|nr:hypothetical protein BD289DRAFT_422433 [Coniella lustricola]
MPPDGSSAVPPSSKPLRPGVLLSCSGLHPQHPPATPAAVNPHCRYTPPSLKACLGMRLSSFIRARGFPPLAHHPSCALKGQVRAQLHLGLSQRWPYWARVHVGVCFVSEQT